MFASTDTAHSTYQRKNQNVNPRKISYIIRHIVDPLALHSYRPGLHDLLRQLRPTITDEGLVHAEFFISAACVRSHALFVFDQELVGMGFLVPICKALSFEGHLEDIVILERCRGNGIGRALIEQLIETGRRQGMSTLTLTSNPENPNRKEAIDLYRKLGFTDRSGLMRLSLNK